VETLTKEISDYEGKIDTREKLYAENIIKKDEEIKIVSQENIEMKDRLRSKESTQYESIVVLEELIEKLNIRNSSEVELTDSIRNENDMLKQNNLELEKRFSEQEVWIATTQNEIQQLKDIDMPKIVDYNFELIKQKTDFENQLQVKVNEIQIIKNEVDAMNNSKIDNDNNNQTVENLKIQLKEINEENIALKNQLNEKYTELDKL
jgi:hypothetical protein